MKGAGPIFRFLNDAHIGGERTALVTLTDVIGSSSRAMGTQLAVSESGAYVGSLSGGCVEAAIVGEARRVIEAGQAEMIRFGSGSPYLDIRLPCGGGIDVLITPEPSSYICNRTAAMLARRETVCLALSGQGDLVLKDAPLSVGWHGGRFHVRHDPALRLIIVGHGEESIAMARMAMAYGCDVVVLTPDERIQDAVAAIGVSSHALLAPTSPLDVGIDRHSAVVLLFHDHDWEADLVCQALAQQPFYLGAMGSRATQAVRLEILARKGLTADLLEHVKGPVGLIPATRDPDTLALSVLAEIVQEYARVCSVERTDNAPKVKSPTAIHECSA